MYVPISISCHMQLGGFYIWTYTYYLIRTSALKFKALEEAEEVSKAPNNNLEATQETYLLNEEHQEHVGIAVASTKSIEDAESQAVSVTATLHSRMLVSALLVPCVNTNMN